MIQSIKDNHRSHPLNLIALLKLKISRVIRLIKKLEMEEDVNKILSLKFLSVEDNDVNELKKVMP